MADSGEKHIVRLRGLPWAATETQIVEFLDGVQVLNGEDGVNKTFTAAGRSTGEAYVEVVTAEDLAHAVTKDKKEMGSRYIEVFRSSVREMEYVLRENDPDKPTPGGAILRLRGLPYHCSKEEIAQFFAGLEIVPNGITLVENGSGKGNGECFVEFSTEEIAESALGKNREKIGHRYIEIFKSSATELTQYLYGGGDSKGGRKNMRSGPYDRPGRGRGRDRGSGYARGGRGGRRGYDDGLGNNYDSYQDYGNDYGAGYDDSWGNGGGGGGDWGYGQGQGGEQYDYGLDDGLDHGGYNQSGGYNQPQSFNQSYDNSQPNRGCIVRMRGLPFRVNEQDVHNFFNPILPVSVEFEYGNDGRMTGEATAIFSTASDAQRAMQKDQQSIQHRYIELFMGPKKVGRGGGGGGGGKRGGGYKTNNYNTGNYNQY